MSSARMRDMQIGELAGRTGVSTKTIRYYEDIGIMPAPPRAANGYRDYHADAVERLGFVRDAQASGLTLTEIGSVLELRRHGEPTCHHVIELVQRHLEEIDRRIEVLAASRDAYATLIERAKALDPADCTDSMGAKPSPPGTPRRSLLRLVLPRAGGAEARLTAERGQRPTAHWVLHPSDNRGRFLWSCHRRQWTLGFTCTPRWR